MHVTTIEELLRALDNAVGPQAAAAVMDEIEGLIEIDPDGSRAAILGYAGDESIRLRFPRRSGRL